MKIVFSVKETGIPMIGPDGAIERIQKVLGNKQFNYTLNLTGEIKIEGEELSELDADRIAVALQVSVSKHYGEKTTHRPFDWPSSKRK